MGCLELAGMILSVYVSFLNILKECLFCLRDIVRSKKLILLFVSISKVNCMDGLIEFICVRKRSSWRVVPVHSPMDFGLWTKFALRSYNHNFLSVPKYNKQHSRLNMSYSSPTSFNIFIKNNCLNTINIFNNKKLCKKIVTNYVYKQLNTF